MNSKSLQDATRCHIPHQCCWWLTWQQRVYTQMSFFLQCKRNNPCSPGGFFSALQSILGLTQLNLSVSPLLSSSQRKVCRTSYHSSDFQFVSDSTQRPNTIHRQTKDSLRKQTSVLCRTHTCQSITATAHLFKQSEETGSYLPYFYLRYNMCSISLRTCHWDICVFFSHFTSHIQNVTSHRFPIVMSHWKRPVTPRH